jgi:hypothetical protein
MVTKYQMDEKVNDKSLDVFEQIYVQKKNWTVARQNVTVAILLTSIIGAFTVLNINVGYTKLIYIGFIFAILFEYWAILNFEKRIIEYDINLEEHRSLWRFKRDTMVWWFFKIDSHVNIDKLKLLLIECLIFIVLISFYLAKYPLNV